MSSVGQPLSLRGGRQQGICQPEACQESWLAGIQGWKQQTAPCQRGTTSALILLLSSLQGEWVLVGGGKHRKVSALVPLAKWTILLCVLLLLEKNVLSCMYAVM